MTPNLTKTNLTGERSGDSESFRYFVIKKIFLNSQTSNFPNKIVSKLGFHFLFAALNKLRALKAPMFFATCCSSLFSPVATVIRKSAEEKMTRPDTRRIVASVADAHSSGDFTFMDCPRVSMGANVLFVRAKSCVTSSFVDRAKENPTLTKMRHVWRNGTVLINFLPKSLLNCFESLEMSIYKHKTKTHPAPQKCYRHIEGRNCEAGWKDVLSPMFLIGYNKATQNMTHNFQGVNHAV